MISMDKKYKTRGGSEVVLYCTDAPGKQPVHGRVGKDVYAWTKGGCFFDHETTNRLDLVEIKPISTEEEIDLLVQKHILKGQNIDYKPFKHSTNITDAMFLLDYLSRIEGYSWYMHNEAVEGYEVSFGGFDHRQAKTLPMAICLAALETVGIKREG